MGWVIPVKGAQSARWSMEELLFQMVSRTLLPAVERLEDLQEPSPTIAIVVRIDDGRHRVRLCVGAHLYLQS